MSSSSRARSPHPVPFIQEQGGKLSISEEAAQALRSFTGTLGVTTVAGVYRTGKSYILNQLAGVEKSKDGFGVGSTVQACTKGIWMWSTPLKSTSRAPDAPDSLLILDTEGLQSLSATEGHDAKIFSLAILLSSFFVYNSDKAINNSAVDQLSLVAQLTKRIRVQAEQQGSGGGGQASEQALAAFFPRFVWLLRDFQLELAGSEGEALSTDEYLEDCLRPQPGSSAATQEQNRTRAAIRSLFVERSCTALPHPTLGTTLPPSALKDLPPLSKLHAGFRDGVVGLKSDILSGCRAKTVGGSPLSGPMLLRLAEAYVAAINDGALPTISSAWQSVIALEGTRALTEATKLYADGAAAAIGTEVHPVEECVWLAAHAKLQAEAVAHFRRIAVNETTTTTGSADAAAEVGGGGGDGFEAQLMRAIDAERKRAEEVLSLRSHAACSKVGAALCNQLSEYARAATSSKEGSVEAYGHSERLPALLAEIMSEYEKQAVGVGKASGRSALLQAAIPLMRDTLKALEAAAAAARKDAQGVASRLDSTTNDLAVCRRELEASRADVSDTRREMREQQSDANKRADEVRKEAEARAGAAAKQLAAVTAERDASTRGYEAAVQRTESRTAESKLLEEQLQTAQATVKTTRAQLETATAENALEAERHAAAMTAKECELAAASAELAALRELHARPPLAAAAPPPAPRGGSSSSSSVAVAVAPPPAAASNKRGRSGRSAVPRPASATDHHEQEPESVQPTVADVGAAAFEEEEVVEEEEVEDVAPRKARRSSVDASALAVPALQAKLKAILGPKAKLPRKKPELLALYLQHASAAD
jgi:hypothetical protein